MMDLKLGNLRPKNRADGRLKRPSGYRAECPTGRPKLVAACS